MNGARLRAAGGGRVAHRSSGINHQWAVASARLSAAAPFVTGENQRTTKRLTRLWCRGLKKSPLDFLLKRARAGGGCNCHGVVSREGVSGQCAAVASTVTARQCAPVPSTLTAAARVCATATRRGAGGHLLDRAERQGPGPEGASGQHVECRDLARISHLPPCTGAGAAADALPEEAPELGQREQLQAQARLGQLRSGQHVVQAVVRQPPRVHPHHAACPCIER